MRYRQNRKSSLLLLVVRVRTQLKNSMKERGLKSQMVNLQSYKILQKQRKKRKRILPLHLKDLKRKRMNLLKFKNLLKSSSLKKLKYLMNLLKFSNPLSLNLQQLMKHPLLLIILVEKKLRKSKRPKSKVNPQGRRQDHPLKGLKVAMKGFNHS